MSDSNVFSPDFREFVELLIKHEVKYLVTGGYVVGIYGHHIGDMRVVDGEYLIKVKVKKPRENKGVPSVVVETEYIKIQ